MSVGTARGVEISSDGNTVYVADANNVLVALDITTPASPSLVGVYDTEGEARGVSISSDGNTAYVADFNNGLVIIDITNPAKPVEL